MDVRLTRRVKLTSNYEIAFVWKLFPVLVEYVDMDFWRLAYTFRIQIKRDLKGLDREVTIIHELTYVKHHLLKKFSFGLFKKWWVDSELEAYAKSIAMLPRLERASYILDFSRLTSYILTQTTPSDSLTRRLKRSSRRGQN